MRRKNNTVSKELPTPFRLRVVNAVTGATVPGAQVTYSIISFTGTNDITISSASPSGATLRVFNTITDTYGFSRVYLKLGSEKGTYIVRARCESCLSGQEQIARGTALTYDVIDAVERRSTGDPNPDPRGDCPDCCNPVTPVLRVTQVPQLGNGYSFTSAEGENKLRLYAQLLPGCLGQSSITWDVADDTGDYIASGINIPQPPPGPSASFTVDDTILPDESAGRALPLAYKVTANTNYRGRLFSAIKKVQQDEIDKCRQEYIDLSKAEINQDLTTSEYLSRYNRSTFTTGVDGVIDPDYVKFIDCFAHIYPHRGQDVENLRTNPNITFPIDVKSGYRSPRKNWLQSPQGVWNSEHQFGDGIDIVPRTVTAQDRARKFKALWENTNCPKILETDGATVMAFCKTAGDAITYKPPYSESNMFEFANCLHLGK